MTIREDVARAVEELDAADDVAAFLLSRGHRGFKCVAHNCPVARFIESDTQTAGISVGPLGVFWPCVGLDYVPVSQKINEFMARFDNGDFPELVIDHSEVGAYV